MHQLLTFYSELNINDIFKVKLNSIEKISRLGSLRYKLSDLIWAIINNCQILIVVFSIGIRDNIEFTTVFRLKSLLSTFDSTCRVWSI